MTKHTHTPGPWVVHESGGFCYIRPADHEPGVMAVAQICKRPNYEQKPNARLISAAPEMLAALDELLALHDNAANNGPRPTSEQIEDWYKRVEKQARAALAKARGT